jgi:GTP pyrophosphokinase
MANQITNIISNEYGINMRSINLDAHDGIFEGHLYLYIHNADNLNTLISKLLKLKGIDTVTRMDN